VSRPVIPYKLTWLDQRFRASLNALPPGKKAACTQRLAELLAALKECDHPINDPSLRTWRPSTYYVAGYRPPCRLVEYRLPFEGFRVIACYFGSKPEIFLAAATLTHDHAELKRLLREHSRRLSSIPDTGFEA
jgi:hypothetical protein